MESIIIKPDEERSITLPDDKYFLPVGVTEEYPTLYMKQTARGVWLVRNDGKGDVEMRFVEKGV